MNEQKGFITRFGELIDEYRADRQRTREQGSQTQSGRLRYLLHWLAPNGGTLLLIAILLLTQNAWARPAASPATAPGPSATTVNYQGRLADSGGAPLDGSYGMSFSLWDAAADGSLVWGPENHVAVPVSEGLFSVGLGSQTGGGIPTSVWNGDRYLEIAVGGETLSPRELIRSVPVAGMALTVPDGAIGSRQMAPSWYQDYDASVISNDTTDWMLTNTSVAFSCETDCTPLILHRALVAHSVQDERVDVRILVDGSIIFRELGVSNVVHQGSAIHRSWQQVSGFDFINLSAGSHTVEVEFKCFSTSPCYYAGYESNWEHLNVLVFSQP